jgi:hemerythrin
MNSFAWKPIYSVGDDDIDHQHRALLVLMNEYYGCQLKGTHDKAREVLARLLALTVRHFREEEERMAQVAYPFLPEHKLSHQDLLKSVEGLVHEYRSAPSTETAGHLATFLKVWLTRHILGSDKRYGPYLQKQAAKRASA